MSVQAYVPCLCECEKRAKPTVDAADDFGPRSRSRSCGLRSFDHDSDIVPLCFGEGERGQSLYSLLQASKVARRGRRLGRSSHGEVVREKRRRRGGR